MTKTLTSSIYVPGNLNDPRNVILNIGTGYYVEKELISGTYVIVQMNYVGSMNIDEILIVCMFV